MFNIEEELKKLPGKPGVYIMHDKNDEIIYDVPTAEDIAPIIIKKQSKIIF